MVLASLNRQSIFIRQSTQRKRATAARKVTWQRPASRRIKLNKTELWSISAHASWSGHRRPKRTSAKLLKATPTRTNRLTRSISKRFIFKLATTPHKRLTKSIHRRTFHQRETPSKGWICIIRLAGFRKPAATLKIIRSSRSWQTIYSSVKEPTTTSKNPFGRGESIQNWTASSNFTNRSWTRCRKFWTRRTSSFWTCAHPSLTKKQSQPWHPNNNAITRSLRHGSRLISSKESSRTNKTGCKRWKAKLK